MQPPCLCLNLHLTETIQHSLSVPLAGPSQWPATTPPLATLLVTYPQLPTRPEQMSLTTTSWKKQKVTEGTCQCSTIQPTAC